MVVHVPDELRLPLPADYAPASPLEDRIVNDACPVRVDRVFLANEVVRLSRAAAYVAHSETTDAHKPLVRTTDLSIPRMATYLTNTLGDRFTRDLRLLGWIPTFDMLKTACEVSVPSEAIDVAPRLRATLAAALRSSASQADALALFRVVLDIVAPVFAGDVTRDDLSP